MKFFCAIWKNKRRIFNPSLKVRYQSKKWLTDCDRFCSWWVKSKLFIMYISNCKDYPTWLLQMSMQFFIYRIDEVNNGSEPVNVSITKPISHCMHFSAGSGVLWIQIQVFLYSKLIQDVWIFECSKFIWKLKGTQSWKAKFFYFSLKNSNFLFLVFCEKRLKIFLHFTEKLTIKNPKFSVDHLFITNAFCFDDLHFAPKEICIPSQTKKDNWGIYETIRLVDNRHHKMWSHANLAGTM